ncbi:MAG TPA: LuxR C-terminal-related transcriptional regulator, partial [Acidimicrobiales bacterium]|nr:LuxR C-terminal-related transcriptional regulator [Acidimicrobiales bacterium]
LAVDDLQWGDADSVELLSLLCRRLEGLAVAVVATARPWPSGALGQARALVHDGFADLEGLEPLSGVASAALLEERAGKRLPESFVEAATRACAGNPFLLSEVAEAHARGEELVVMSSTRLAEHIFLPRFAGIGEPAMHWARAASVLGTRFRADLVHHISGQGPAEAGQALSALCAAGLVRAPTSGEAEFVHALFRQGLYDDLSPPLRQDLHAKALAALMEEGAPPVEAAPHALAAGRKGDQQAIGVLVAAGRQALAAGAVGSAAEHFEAALSQAGRAAQPGLRFELAGACLLTGKLALAEEVLCTLLGQEGLRDADRVAAMRLQARVLLVTTRYREAKERFKEASDLAAGYDQDLAAEILLDFAFMGTLLEGPRAVRDAVASALQMLASSGTASGALRLAALYADGNISCLGGDHSLLDELVAAARSALERKDLRPAWSWDIVLGAASMCKIAERFEESMTMAELVMEAAKNQGAALTYLTFAISHSDTMWRLGHLKEHEVLLREALDLLDCAPTLAPFTYLGITASYYEQGAQASCAAWAGKLDVLLANAGESPYMRLWLCLFACHNKLRTGNLAEAVGLADHAASTALESGLLEPCLVPWHGAAIEAYVAAGQLDRAEQLASWLEEICRPLPCHAPRAVAAWGRATVAWRRGALDIAERGFQEALGHNAVVPMPLAHAETLIAYGRFLRHTGRPGGAREALHKALTILEPTGAGRLQAIAREELAGAGGRRSRAGPSGQLTATELRVARLAAQGRTNAEIARALFMSDKTVGHHLSSAYRKLGVPSRRELAAVLENGSATG